MLLLLDNYDSFVHNLARYFERLGQRTCVVRSDAIDAAGVRAMRPDAVVLSPGPCTPQKAGASLAIVRALYRELPMLGVCLGHQTIAEALGGRIVRAPRPVHGQTSAVTHDGTSLFADLPSPLAACRYHSLVVDANTLPAELRPTASTDDGLLMAFEHTALPLYGVQFHPEAVLTEFGYELLANFLRLAGLEARTVPDRMAAEELGATGCLSNERQRGRRGERETGRRGGNDGARMTNDEGQDKETRSQSDGETSCWNTDLH